jgi:hypothetical protein
MLVFINRVIAMVPTFSHFQRALRQLAIRLAQDHHLRIAEVHNLQIQFIDCLESLSTEISDAILIGKTLF